ncbi:MAG: hypothetical protein ACKO8I_01995 [Cyanobacteriota bacterium]
MRRHHLLRSRLSVNQSDFVLQLVGLLPSPVPPIQLGQRFSTIDSWLGVPAGTRQHRLQGPLLEPGGGGGSAGVDGGGETGGGTAFTRPSSGLLWPRRV